MGLLVANIESVASWIQTISSGITAGSSLLPEGFRQAALALGAAGGILSELILLGRDPLVEIEVWRSVLPVKRKVDTEFDAIAEARRG